MDFKKIEKINDGKFISRYDITYETVDNKLKVYEMISRSKSISSLSELHNGKTDAVVLILHNENEDKVLLNKEFRLAVGEWVYNFPAGLIDPGEDEIKAAKRELKEETGLDLIEIKDILSDSYSAVGFSNEKNKCVIGIATGEFAKSSSTVEEIEPAWFTKEQIKELLKTERFAARTQAYCYLWANS